MTQFKVVDEISVIPQHDFVLVKVDPSEDMELTSGGIIIPHGVIQNKKTGTGVIVAVGPGRYDHNGKKVPMLAKVDSRVIFAAFIGYPIALGVKGLHIIIKDYDLMGEVFETSHYVDEEDFNATELENAGESDADSEPSKIITSTH